MIKKMFLAILVLGIFASSCSSDDDNGSTTSNLTLNLSGLEDLGSDFVYEGWIIVDGSPVSTGRFTSVTFPQIVSINTVQLESATKFILTIEPNVDSDLGPSATKILAGDFSGNSATVGIGPITVPGENFEGSWGKFFLRTPTDETGTNNGNDENGIWFGIPGTMPPAAGLNLPTLDSGWKYEGWVVVDGVGPLSTGTFTSFDTVDDSNNFSGLLNNVGPPIPGEDFFNNEPAGFTFPIDVRGRTIVISIEPSPDNSPGPFLLKPLIGTAGQETAPNTHDLSFSSASFPTGTVTR